jgi:Flp pilus assembly protein CpaB
MVNQRRTLILVAAIAIGALGSFLVWNYVKGVRDDALGDAEQVQVYVVKEPIPRGTDGLAAQQMLQRQQIPRKFLPGNAITDPQDISGKVAVSPLPQNQVVVSDMFVDASDPSARSSFSERLNRVRNEDQVAITVQVNQVRGVAGLIRPGDFVNVMIAKVSEVGTADGGGPAIPEGVNPEDILFGAQARYLYQKVEVIAVGQNSVPQPGGTTTAATAADGTTTNAPANVAAANDSGLITVMVPAKGAQYLASVPPENIYLVLVARDYKPVAQTKIDLAAVLPGENPAQITPYGPKGPESGS